MGCGFGTVGPSMWQKCRKFASEKANPGKMWEILHQKRTRQGSLVQKGKKCGKTWEILHLKRTNPVKNPGFLEKWGQKCGKNMGNLSDFWGLFPMESGSSHPQSRVLKSL